MKKWHKSALVVAGAVMFSTVAIQASDMVRGIEGNLTGLVMESSSVCGSGAVPFLLGDYSVCVDQYEASASDTCPYKNPSNAQETQENANERTCTTVSTEGSTPWRFVSFTQASQLCARDGKRLPTNEEWYKFASGLTDFDACYTNGKESAPRTTGGTACVTPAGIHDVVGNVWEWIDAQVVDGVYDSRSVPASGFVSLVDTSGVVLSTAGSGVTEFGNDYAWTDTSGVRGVIRGGFFGSGSDAGIFAQNLSVPLDLKTTGVGFRCLRQL